jgi:hypothetical protein
MCTVRSFALRGHCSAEFQLRPTSAEYQQSLYQIPEPAGNHTKIFTDKPALEAFRFTIRLPLVDNMPAEARGESPRQASDRTEGPRKRKLRSGFRVNPMLKSGSVESA